MPQGQGTGTWWKERGLGSALTTAFRVTKKVGDHLFHYADLNCGSGWNEEAHCQGSPLVALSVFRRYPERSVRAYFVDSDPLAIARLRQAFTGVELPGRDNIICADNHDFVPEWHREIRRLELRPYFASGLVFIDPNGEWEQRVPYSALTELFHAYPRIDVVANYNLRYWQMARPWLARGVGHWGEKLDVRVRGLLRDWRKQYGWIMERNTRFSRFVTVWCCNYPLQNGHPQLGWHLLDSVGGQEILRRVDGEEPSNATPA